MKALLGLATVAGIVCAMLVLDVPGKLADLGSGNLDRLVAPKTTASFGEPVDLPGRAPRPSLEVTAREAVRARSTTRGVRADKKHRFVAVDLTIRNTGDGPWSSTSAGNRIEVEDEQGVVYGVDADVLRVRGAKVLRPGLILQPGRAARGVAVFGVPRAAEITKVRFTVGSGLTRTAEWVHATE